MLKLSLFLILIASNLYAQPIANKYLIMQQKDSLYYLLTDKALLKFYSHEVSGDFYLTKFIEDNFSSPLGMMLNDDFLFIYHGDSIFYYSNKSPWELEFENVFVPGYPVTSLHNFGPYFFIRSGNIYKLMKIENGLVITIDESLFTHPSQMLVFFTFPYVVIANDVYKYVEGGEFSQVGQILIGNVMMGINGNTIVSYVYIPPCPFPQVCPPKSFLHKYTITEPDFPRTTIDGWGLDVSLIHNMYGQLIPKKNLYYFYTSRLVLKADAITAYAGVATDRIAISDYYIFLLNGDTLKFSKWDEGSTFYPFTWVDMTSVRPEIKPELNYYVSQNYPNPFNPSTVIRYQLPITSYITLKVYDILGKEVETLVDEPKSPGTYEINFKAKQISSGIYYYQMRAGGYFETRKMIYIK